MNFSIVGLMVSATVASLVTFATTEYASQSIDGQRYLASELAGFDAESLLFRYINHPAHCTKMVKNLDIDLSGYSIPDISLTSINLISGVPIIKDGSNFLSQLKVNSIRISEINAPSAFSKFYTANLTVDFVNNGIASMPKKIPFQFSVTGQTPYKIAKCENFSNSIEDTCVELGGSMAGSPPVCVFPDNLALICQNFGGTFNSTPPGSCDLGSSTASAEEICNLLGGSYDLVDKKCVLLPDEEKCQKLGGIYEISTKTCRFASKSAEDYCLELGGSFSNEKCLLGEAQKDFCKSLSPEFVWTGKDCVRPPSDGLGFYKRDCFANQTCSVCNQFGKCGAVCDLGDTLLDIESSLAVHSVSDLNTIQYYTGQVWPEGSKGILCVSRTNYRDYPTNCGITCVRKGYEHLAETYIRKCPVYNWNGARSCGLGCNLGDTRIGYSAGLAAKYNVIESLCYHDSSNPLVSDLSGECSIQCKREL